MAAGYWTETRPNGKPIEAGTVCWVTEPIDGGHPIHTYGKDQQEVIEKLARTNAHAQAALARKAAPAAAATSTPAATAPVRMTADEVMQATQDLQNPAKAGTAVAKLVQDATGIDLGRLALNNFATLAQEWQQENPEFYEHPGNQHLLVSRAKAYAGGAIANVTKEHLSRAFDDLQHEGMLFEAPAQSQPTNNPPTPSPVPEETQVQRTERPRGSRFATSTRSTGFRAAPQHSSQTRTPKYTAEEIRTMPESKSRSLVDSNDRDYAESCEYHFSDQATA